MNEDIKSIKASGFKNKQYKGVTKIELTDVKTGEKEVIEKENIVTDAVYELLGKNPFGAFQYSTVESEDQGFNSSKLPIRKLFGGILLFEDELELNKKNIFFPRDKEPVAWAGDTANSGYGPDLILSRGSINTVETGPIQNGYKFVWEWNETQGNGTFSCLSLTHASNGNRASIPVVKSITNDTKQALLEDTKVMSSYSSLTNTSTRYDEEYLNNTYGAQYCDYKNDLFYKFYIVDSNTIKLTITKRGINNIPISQVNTPDKSTPVSSKDKMSYLVKEELFTTTTTMDLQSSSLVASVGKFGNKLYIAEAKNNETYIKLISFDISDIDNIVKEERTIHASQKLRISCSVSPGPNLPNANILPILDGYIYIPSYSSTTEMLKINIENGSTQTIFSEASSPITSGILLSVFNIILEDEGAIYLNPSSSDRGVYIKNDKMYNIPGYMFGSIMSSVATGDYRSGSILRIGELTYIYHWGYTTSTPRVSTRFIVNTNYLATINNLPSPITKTDAKKMKITYTITEIES